MVVLASYYPSGRTCSELSSREQTDSGLNPIPGPHQLCSSGQIVKIFSFHLLCVNALSGFSQETEPIWSLFSVSLNRSISRETDLFYGICSCDFGG